MVFWVCYIYCGLSDLLDGPVARYLKQQSEKGARLDSFADLTFAASIFVVVIRTAVLPVWLWVCVTIIAVIKLIGYGVGFYKYRTFVELHTVLSKTAGVCIFVFPLLYAASGIVIAGITVCIIAFLASAEELILILQYRELDRDQKSLFITRKSLNK